MSERLTEGALRPRSRGGVHSRLKCTPSTRLSVVTREIPPSSTPAASSATPTSPLPPAGAGSLPSRRPRRWSSSRGGRRREDQRGPPQCRVEGDLNLVTRWEPY